MQTARLRISLFGSLLFSLLSIVVAYSLANRYIDRLPNHDGYYLVPVENTVSVPVKTKPKRTVVIVVDGLGYEFARTMTVSKHLANLGQCHPTSTGELTISRPVYTVISSGVEVDRTGTRNNDETRPASVQSIWQVAHAAGLKVHAASELRWWDELFPDTFSVYLHEPDTTANLFTAVELGDLTLIHPVRVDTAGHSYGASSSQYREAVALTDAEISQFVDTLDMHNDLLIFTADHGHSASGGHGGPDPSVSTVLTCFVGAGVRKGMKGKLIDARVLAPTVSVLMGIPFPKHMRAVEDSLDTIWSIVEPSTLGHSYVEGRKRDIELFREANHKQLSQWTGQDSGLWSDLYRQERRSQNLLWLAAVIFSLVGLFFSYRLRNYSIKKVFLSVVWMASVVLLICIAYTLVRGSFDFTSINRRDEFLRASLAVCLSVGLTSLIIHWLLSRNLKSMLADQLTLIALLFFAGLMHLWVYGVPLGFPLPGRVMLFFPFLNGAMGISLGALSGILSLIALGQHFRKSASL